MIKKILFFYILLFISIFSYSQESYYNDVNLDLTGTALKNALATKIIATHTNILFYSPGVWEASQITDLNPSNSAEVLLIYGYSASGTTSRTRGIDHKNGASDGWNREHTFPKSLASPSLSTSDPGPGTDAHNLRPADPSRNGSRGNKKFASGTGNSGDVTGGWYPGDEWKGDVARMMMYMYVRYNGNGSNYSETNCLPTAVGVGSAAATPDDMIDLFLQWNVEDPVSDFEKTRNTYHENTSNTYAQGNRNPFIDNPYLATRIWGSTPAEDVWGYYASSDTEAPTVPTNVTLSNITTSAITVSWTASTDNVAVTSYDVYVDGVFTASTSSTSTTLSDLNTNTTYAITVAAVDFAENKSAKTTVVNGTTLVDSTAPSVPTNIVISNETDTTLKITWTASTDNTAVTGYEIYFDTNLVETVSATTYTASSLTHSTTYSVEVLAKDAANNKSAKSTAVNATTTNGSSSNATEIFFSEYFEGSVNNKAVELANATGATVSLTGYSIKRQSNGSGVWQNELDLSGSIAAGDVYVIINGASDDATLIAQADMVVANASPNWGAPINFNGNDPVGLFKDDNLVDIIGTFDGGTSNFAKDVTLRRKATVASPNTTFDKTNEWDEYAKDTAGNIGVFNTTLSVNDFNQLEFTIYPNPLNGKFLTITTTASQKIKELKIYTVNGKEVVSITNPKSTINLNGLQNGLYLVKLISDKGIEIQKLIKN